MINDIHVPIVTSRFYRQKDLYLSSTCFHKFEQIAGVDLSRPASGDPGERRKAQLKLCNKSVILNAIRSTIGDYLCPIVYTHELDLAPSVPEHNPDIDKIILAGDLTDSLRRRHLALSFSILPRIIQKLSEKKGKAISVENLGSVPNPV